MSGLRGVTRVADSEEAPLVLDGHGVTRLGAVWTLLALITAAPVHALRNEDAAFRVLKLLGALLAPDGDGHPSKRRRAPDGSHK